MTAGVGAIASTITGGTLAGPSGGDLVVIVDGRGLLRREIPVEVGEADRIDVDVGGGRRLELIVDFPADSADGQSGLGRLRLHDPRLEK